MHHSALRIESDIGAEKRCAACEQYWPADAEFYAASKGRDGLSPRCRACVAERFRGYGVSRLRARADVNAIPA